MRKRQFFQSMRWATWTDYEFKRHQFVGGAGSGAFVEDLRLFVLQELPQEPRVRRTGDPRRL